MLLFKNAVLFIATHAAGDISNEEQIERIRIREKKNATFNK